MSAVGAEYGGTQPNHGDVITQDWVREVVTDHAFSMQSEFDKAASKLEKKIEEATAKMQKATEHQNGMMKDLLEKMGTLARALSEEQRRGVERDHDMESILGLNLNNQRQSGTFSGAHATNQEVAQLRKEIAEIRGMRQVSSRKTSKAEEGNPADELDQMVKNLRHAVVEMEDQIKKCIVKLAENDKRFGKMEKKHTLSIISLSIFSLKALSFPRDQRERTEEALKREEMELRETLHKEDGAEESVEEEDDEEGDGRRIRNIYNDDDSDGATDVLAVEGNLISALSACRKLIEQLDVANRRRDGDDVVQLTERLHEATNNLDKAKRDAGRVGYTEKNDEIARIYDEIMTYVNTP